MLKFMLTKSAIRNLAVPFILFLLWAETGCQRSIVFPTGINGVALEETGSGNVNPPPPPTYSPLAGAIITVQSDGGGREIARGVADSQGGFRVELPPGTYLLVPLVPPDQGFVLAPSQQTVVVTPNTLTQVVFTYSVVSHF
jgi:hypothetical protein